MRKSELEKLRTLNATPAMIRALQEPGTKRHYSGKINEEKYHLAARCQQLGGYLKVSICTRKDIGKKVYTPKWDIYINYEGDEYITRERQKDGSYKWREAYGYNLEEYSWYKHAWDEYVYISSEGSRQIQKLLGTKEKGFVGICKWQEGCKKRNEDKKIKKLTDQWDKDMEPIKDPPKGFEDWWHRNGFDGKNYIFYRSARSTEGYCTSCIGKVKLPGKPKHNAEGRCPVCRKKVMYISRAKKTQCLCTGEYEVSCIQRYKEGLVQRDFAVYRYDYKDDWAVNRSDYGIREYRRTIVTEKGWGTYIYTDYRRRGMRWALDRDAWIGKYREIMYRKNFSQIFKKYHTAYPIAVKHGYTEAGLRYFLRQEHRYPAIEMAYKAGLYRLAKDMANDSWLQLDEILDNKASGGLAKILKIDNARMKRLKNMDGNMEMLIWLQKEKQMNTILRDCDIKTLSEADISPKELEGSTIRKYLTIEKICNYLNKQAGLRSLRGRELKTAVWRDWNDYVNMMAKLKMDCSRELLLKPKDLAIAHNELVAKISMLDSSEEIAKKKIDFPRAQELMKSGELKKYEYDNGTYCIVAPRSIDDIYREGIVLKHCIHTCDIYFQRINIRETYLLFLRHSAEPDTPWYTVEIEPGGNIRQKKSVLNEAYKDLDDAMPFLQEWQQWVKKNLSEEDKKLAAKSDKARREGYKKLREEKKIILHGSLQGALLADALESDFMEVI